VAADLVEVHLFAAARAAVGQSVLTADAGTLASILTDLEAAHPAFVRVRPQCSYLVDGVSVHGDPMIVEVPFGSRLDVLPPFAGG
jgi:molybdopterin synthase sulfur carrier subunit